jgi:hypothetical protein
MTTLRTKNQLGAPLDAFHIYQSYQRSPYLSVKHSAYFQVYEELLSRFRGKPITFVEIGVLNGGSLFMWRDFFGPQARIIGVDLNPLAKRWEQDGFEIFIGSQSSPQFWDEFYDTVGMVDVLLDDGGHTNEQQIVTTHHSLPFIRDNGLLIVEDVHASYQAGFGNPSHYSFINYAKLFIDGINARFPGVEVKEKMFRDLVYSVHFYDSIVSFSVDRKKCYENSPISNKGQTLDAEDFCHHDNFASNLNQYLSAMFAKIHVKFSMGKILHLFEKPFLRWRLKKYFK